MRVLIVDDSALVRGILKEVLKSDPKIEVVGEATNGEDGVSKNRQLKPDLIIMDINMPKMDGITATQIILQESPVPIAIFSSEVDAVTSFHALHFGAVDVIRKPEIDKFNDASFRNEFLERIHLVSQASLMLNGFPVEEPSTGDSKDFKGYKIVVIGASTGGPAAVRTVLSSLPKDLSVPVALVQHLESGFENSYAQWLASHSSLPVEIPKNGTKLKGGHVYIAPTDKHLLIRGDEFLLDDGEKVLNQKPSVNLLFESASLQYGRGVLAVLLTGMGKDGARGCVEVKGRGGYTIAQDEKSSAIFGMPKAAIEEGGVTKILPLGEISDMISRLVYG